MHDLTVCWPRRRWSWYWPCPAKLARRSRPKTRPRRPCLCRTRRSLPPLTAKDIEAPAKQVAPAPTKEEPKQNATTAPAEPTKAATNAAPADAVGEKLRELITGRQFDRLVSRKSDRAGIEAYYSSHNYAPIWISNNAGNDRAKAAIAYLGQADAVGLDPNDYPTPDFKSATTADALAEAELKLTASALTFARHAQIGRIHFTRVGADIQYDLVAPEPADVLAKLGDSSDAGQGA